MAGKSIYFSADQLTALGSFVRLHGDEFADQVNHLIESTELPGDFDLGSLIDKIDDAEMDCV